jgi:hypothetical protein
MGLPRGLACARGLRVVCDQGGGVHEASYWNSGFGGVASGVGLACS